MLTSKRTFMAKGVMLSLALSLAGVTGAFAQDYPKGQVTIIVPFAAGGPTDTIARLYGEQLSKTFGQPVIVENVAGAGGSTGTGRAAKAAPDGQTLLIHNIAPHVAGPALYSSATYDPVNDFEPVASLAEAAIYVVVRKDFPAKTLAEFVAYAKANAGKVNFASAGAGSATHLACELFKQRAGVDMVHIPYRGTGPALNDLVSGKVDMMCDQGLNMGAQLKADAIRGLAIAQDMRSKTFPDVPTAAEAGVKDFVVNASTALYAPKGTPKPIVDKIAKAVQDAAKTDVIKTRTEQLVSEFPAGNRMSPEGLRDFTASEAKKWTTAIKDGNIKAN